MAEKFLYLTTSGRITGNPHKIEIWFVEHEDVYYLCTEFPDKSDTVKNIRKNNQVSFYIAEQGQVAPEREGVASIVEDETLLPILREKFDAKYNWSAGMFIGISTHN